MLMFPLVSMITNLPQKQERIQPIGAPSFIMTGLSISQTLVLMMSVLPFLQVAVIFQVSYFFTFPTLASNDTNRNSEMITTIQIRFILRLLLVLSSCIAFTKYFCKCNIKKYTPLIA